MIYKIDDYKIKNGSIEVGEYSFPITIDTLILKNKSFILTSDEVYDFTQITQEELDLLIKNNVDKPSMQQQINDLTILLADVLGGAI